MVLFYCVPYCIGTVIQAVFVVRFAKQTLCHPARREANPLSSCVLRSKLPVILRVAKQTPLSSCALRSNVAGSTRIAGKASSPEGRGWCPILRLFGTQAPSPLSQSSVPEGVTSGVSDRSSRNSEAGDCWHCRKLLVVNNGISELYYSIFRSALHSGLRQRLSSAVKPLLVP